MMKAEKYFMVGSDLVRSQLLQLNECYKNDSFLTENVELIKMI